MELASASKALAALAQPSRLRVFRELVQAGPSGMAAGEIAAELEIAPATLSFHLKEMAHAGLVVSRQSGRFIYYSANFDQMNALVGFLTENCCQQDGVTCAPAPRCNTRKRPASRSKRKGAKL